MSSFKPGWRMRLDAAAKDITHPGATTDSLIASYDHTGYSSAEEELSQDVLELLTEVERLEAKLATIAEYRSREP